MIATLRVEAETYAYNKEVTNVSDLHTVAMRELDEQVVEVSIKKKDADDKNNHMCSCANERQEKVIDVLGVRYTIKEVDVVNASELRKGEINYLTNEIRINKGMPASLKNQVLMHEVLHATFDLLGLDELAESEEKVQSIATALHQIFSSQTIFSF